MQPEAVRGACNTLHNCTVCIALLPQTKYKELGLKPYVAHATFQYSGTPGKRNRFREFLLWDDPPSYFDSAKGFISMQ